MAEKTSPLMIARAALTQICEPTDHLAHHLIESLGAEHALRSMTGSCLSSGESAALKQAAAEAGFERTGQAAEKARRRWTHRAETSCPEEALRFAGKIGAALITPEHPQWPEGLRDLGPEEPYALWLRGTAQPGTDTSRRHADELLMRLPSVETSCAIVGSRASTSYGQLAASEITRVLCAHGISIISGGAFGIDQQAHSTALRSPGAPDTQKTFAVMACGLDRFYPAAHEHLLKQIMEHGLLVSELPPGAAPTRWRFLQRNRLIAALSRAVVVPEAGERSGALSTAGHAGRIGREVGAVPGPVTSSASRGCHRLIREEAAQLISLPEHALELMGIAAPQRQSEAERRVTDGMNQRQQIVFEATPLGTPASSASIARTAGCAPQEAEAELALFLLAGIVEQTAGGRWKRSGSHR